MRGFGLLLLFSCALPPRDAEVFRTRGLPAKYWLYPVSPSCSLRGDFDGDHRADVAFSIEDTSTELRGIAICLAASKTCDILGAGTPFHDDNDFSWMDAWSRYPRDRRVGRGAGEGSPPRLRGDAILVEKTESASALIYWDARRRRFAWYQQGD